LWKGGEGIRAEVEKTMGQGEVGRNGPEKSPRGGKGKWGRGRKKRVPSKPKSKKGPLKEL